MRLTERRKLLRLMIVEGVSGRKLAQVAGYQSHSYLQRVLRGERDGVNVDAAERIVDHFGLTLRDLFLPDMSNELDKLSDGKDKQ